MKTRILTPALLDRMDAHWRAANYPSVRRPHPYADSASRSPLTLSHIKDMLLEQRAIDRSQRLEARLVEHEPHGDENGQEAPEIRDWQRR